MRITADQLRAQYKRNADDLARDVAAAAIATERGKDGPKGKRFRGHFYHQLVAMEADRRASSMKTDEELAPMLNLLNAALGGTETN